MPSWLRLSVWPASWLDASPTNLAALEPLVKTNAVVSVPERTSPKELR